jgi:predicted nucleic acid-binding protein
VKPPLLFDASALLNLILTQGEQAFEPIAQGALLDLTLYEAGNSIWKLTNLHKKLSPEEAGNLIAAVEKLTARTKIITYSMLHLTEAMQTAVEENLTFYDAAYLEAARSLGMTLVTDDRNLRQAAAKYVETAGSDSPKKL